MGRPGNRPAIAAQGLRLQRAFEAGAVLVAAEQELAVQRVDHVDGIAQHDDDLGVRRKRLDLLGGAPRVEVPDGALDRKSTRLKSSHSCASRMPSSARKKKRTDN